MKAVIGFINMVAFTAIGGLIFSLALDVSYMAGAIVSGWTTFMCFIFAMAVTAAK